MENNSRQTAMKFFVTACLLAAIYHFIMTNIRPAVEIDSGYREVKGTPARIIAVAKHPRQAKRSIEVGFDELSRADANAIDKTLDVMKRKGAIGGMVDYDGNIGYFGKPAKNDEWLIDPQEPNSEDSQADANLN